jgi:DNA polymerase
MTLPYDEDTLREMELWPLIDLQQKSMMRSIVPPPTDEFPRPVLRTDPPRVRARASPPRSAAPDPVSPLAADPARAARITQLDWDGLKIEAAACQACGLCKQRKQAVLGAGATDAPWLFVGEGPGSEEDDLGEPFVGPAGKLLDAMLAATGLQRGREVYITNVVKCRPPGNRNPSADEAQACGPLLDRQIDLIQPTLIVALGKIALMRLTGSEASMASMRGKLHEYRGIPVIATYHPAYLLRNLPDKLKAWEDLMMAKRAMADR